MKQLLWTIQTESAYTEFEKSGILVANENHLFCGEDLRFAYDWMAGQMVNRIGAPPPGIRYPVWAWYQWEGKRKRRDLRQAGYAKRGTPLVQITFEAEPCSFLLSDFDAWHAVLMGQYNAVNEADWDDFYQKHPHPSRNEIEPSWERIFDLSHHTPDWDPTPDKQSIQATLWKIELSQVKGVEHFLAK